MRKSLFQVAAAVVPTRFISLEEEIQANIEQTQAVAEVEKTASEIQHAEDAAAVLEDLATVVDKIDEPSPTESALIQITGDALAAGTDADPADLTPSMEDEGGAKNFGQRAKETIKRIIEAIKAAFRRMWEWVKKFFTSTNSVIDAKAQRSKELREKLRKVKFDKPVEMNVKASKLFNKDLKGNEVADRLKETFKAIQQYNAFVDKINKCMVADNKAVVKLAAQAAEGKKVKIPAPSMPGLGKSTGQKKDLHGLTFEEHVFEIPHTGQKLMSYKASGSFEVDNINDLSAYLREVGPELMNQVEAEEPEAEGERKVTISSASELEAGLAVADASFEEIKKINETFTDGMRAAEAALSAIENEASAMTIDKEDEGAGLLSSMTAMLQKASQCMSTSSMRVVKATGDLESAYLALTAQAIASVG